MIDDTIEIDIADEQSHLLLDADWLRSLARHVFRAEGVAEATLSVALVDDRTIHDLNRRFLRHDWPTDVVTFPLSEADQPLHGEVVVGAEYALSQAAEHGWPATHEAALYLVHGILHLCGWDDRAAADRHAMHARQDRLLSEFLARRPAAAASTALHGEASTPPDVD